MVEPRSIGVLSPLGNGFYFGGVINGIRTTAAAAGYRTIVFQGWSAGAEGSESWNPGAFTRPLGWNHVAGFVSIVIDGHDDSLRAIVAAGKPLVLVSHNVPSLMVPVVVPDNAGGTKAAVEHLLGHGHTKIA
ncbi:MAG: hypothetical protein QOC73_1106, partial [Actinomycetota bacterium]|nr:hypothetical protein [Actinomycetota bacterium]